ncbi:MAG: nucleoside triphosphate pyrophosphohydrolase [Clostridia bacterium]|nr:nucleoside triphosphate pyrophosphohydrolase [Clostridia bacterium]
MKYNKLVRDNIPDIIHDQGKGVCFRVLSEAEFKEYLERKLDEEVAEFHENPTLEELADITEVLYALAETHGYSVFDLGRMRRRKLFEKGGFVKRICLLEVEE